MSSEPNNTRVELQADALDARAKATERVTITGICSRCTHAHIWRTARMNEPVVVCQTMYGEPSRVPTDIRECNKFSQVGQLSIYELINLCCDIDLSKGTKKVGFHGDDKKA